MIDSIVGFCTLPIGLIILLKEWGFVDLSKLLPFDLLWIGSLAIIAVQVANILQAHIEGEHVHLSYIIHGLLLFPAVIFFLSKIITMPAALINSLPLVIGSFILVEGMYSFFI